MTNEIVKVSESGVIRYSESPTQQLAVIRDALESPMVNNISDHELYDEIKKQYAIAHADLKFQLPENPKDIQYTCQKVVTNLRRHPKNLRKDEIGIAFTNGINNKYGNKWFGISAVTLNYFIDEYCKDSERAEALRIRNLPPPAKKPPTADEIFSFAKSNALDAYRDFLQNKGVGRLGSPVYDFLFDYRLLIITQEEIDDFFKKANSIYLEELKAKKQINTDPVKNRELSNQVDSFIELMLSTDKTATEKQNFKTAGIVKRLAVEKFFAALQFEDISTDLFANMIDEQRVKKLNYKPKQTN